MIRPFYRLYLAVALSMLWMPAFSERDSISNNFTEQHPLVYEDAWDLWPYSFLSDTGEPAGFNIDLLRIICKELGIPYRIKLKPTQDAMSDLKTGRADLMCAIDAEHFREFAHYGTSVIQIFTHSIAHHKGVPTLVKSTDDLATEHVIVHENSLTYRFMTERGWSRNAITSNDMQEAVQLAHHQEEGQIIGNTMTLKWLLHKFGYDDMELAPVNIPHGEYKFMSNDDRLLAQFDSVFSQLNSTGRLQPIQNKWFYPDHKDTGTPSWVWYMIAAFTVLIITFIAYYLSYRLYERKMTGSLRRSNDRLALILNTSKVHIWLFDIVDRKVTSIDSEGKRTTFPLSPYFEQYYMLPEDYERLCNLLGEMAAEKKKSTTLELQVTRKGTKTRHVFSVDLSVMKRDRKGHPTVIIGASTDITSSRKRQQEQKDTMLRYQHIFNSVAVDTVSYDEHGFIDDMNEKSAKAIGGNVQRVIDAHIPVQSVLGDPSLSLDDLDFTYLTQIFKTPDDDRPLARFLGRDELYYELQMVPIRDDGGQLLGIYGIGRDVTEVAKTYSRLQKNLAKLQEANDELQDYVRNIDYVMKNGGVRIVNYSPETHTLTVYSEIERVQHRLTQTRLLLLTDEKSKKTALRIMNSMDSLTQQPVKAVIKSTIRVKEAAGEGFRPLCLSFSFVPATDADGHVTEYFGMCRDITDIKATEELLAHETKKAQEVEAVKEAFLRNMCYEIRTPLNSVVGFAELIEKNLNTNDEKLFIEEIKKNSRSLLTLVNNILYLSRLDADMIEFKTTTVDFAAFFEERCKSAWLNYQRPGVEYITETFYEHLMLDVDITNLGIVIDQIVTNAAQFTTSGSVHARFDYNGEDLTVAVQDTGCGIPADQHEKVFERFVTTHSGSSGLGLAICQEVVKQMGGKIRMRSEVGKGTIFWVIIPCKIED